MNIISGDSTLLGSPFLLGTYPNLFIWKYLGASELIYGAIVFQECPIGS